VSRMGQNMDFIGKSEGERSVMQGDGTSKRRALFAPHSEAHAKKCDGDHMISLRGKVRTPAL